MPAQSAERERSSLGDKYFVLGLTAILCFAVLTTWVPSRWPVATAQIATYSLGLAWIVRQWLNPRPIHGSWLLIPTAMAAAWGPFQLALGWTVYRFATISKSLDWLACFVVFFLAIQALHGNSNQRLFRQTILWFGLIISALSVLQYFTSEGKIFWVTPSGYGVRVLGPFVNRDHYSVFIELLLPVAIYKLRRNRHPLLYSVAAGTLYASGIAGASRAGAILTTALAIAATLVVFRRYAVPRPANAAILAACLISLTLVVGWEAVWGRLHIPEPFQYRNQLNASSLAMLSVHPWRGFGLGTWPDVYPAYATRSDRFLANAAHDDWAQWAVEGGVGLSASMLWIFVSSAMRGFRAPWALGIPAALLHCAVDFPLQVPALSLWFFAMLGAVAAVEFPPNPRVTRRGRSRPAIWDTQGMSRAHS